MSAPLRCDRCTLCIADHEVLVVRTGQLDTDGFLRAEIVCRGCVREGEDLQADPDDCDIDH